MSLEIQSENLFQSASSNVEGEKDYFCTIAWRRWEELEMRKLYMDIKEYHKENSLKAIPLGLSTQKWVCKGWDYVVAQATVLLENVTKHKGSTSLSQPIQTQSS